MDKPTVYLTQCLCGPARHCILGVATEDAERGEPHCRATIEIMIATDIINPWCDLCDARADKWIYETRPLAEQPGGNGQTLEDVLPALRQCERDQRETALNWKAGRN